MKMSVLHFQPVYTVSWFIQSDKVFFPVEAKLGLYLDNGKFFTIFFKRISLLISSLN